MDLVGLKKKYRQIFFLKLAGTQITFRLPTWREHDIYEKVFTFSKEPRGQIEDKLFRELCLDPILVDEMNNLPAGIVPTVVGVAILLSGNNLSDQDKIDRLNTDLELIRNGVNSNPYEFLIITICKAFPSFKPSEVEDLSYWEVLRLSAMAEQVLALETPIKFVTDKKPKSLTDKLFEDAAAAEKADSVERPKPDRQQDARRPVTPEQVRQAEMIRRIQEKNRSGR